MRDTDLLQQQTCDLSTTLRANTDPNVFCLSTDLGDKHPVTSVVGNACRDWRPSLSESNTEESAHGEKVIDKPISALNNPLLHPGDCWRDYQYPFNNFGNTRRVSNVFRGCELCSYEGKVAAPHEVANNSFIPAPRFTCVTLSQSNIEQREGLAKSQMYNQTSIW